MAAVPPGRQGRPAKGERTSPSTALRSQARRPAQRAPQQDRSRRTRERLLAATEALLAEREYADVSIDDIVDRAHSSIGAFYKHFPGKRELLPQLLERLENQGSEQLAVLLRESHQAGDGLRARVALLLGAMTRQHLVRRRLMRAFVAARFTAQLALRPADVAAARARMEAMRAWLLECRGEIRHPQPEIAVRAGLYLVLQSLQTALLFEELPDELQPAKLTEEAARMLCAYLMEDEA